MGVDTGLAEIVEEFLSRDGIHPARNAAPWQRELFPVRDVCTLAPEQWLVKWLGWEPGPQKRFRFGRVTKR